MKPRDGYDKPLLRQMAWFGLVGTLGFLTDAAGYLLFAGPLGLPPLLARLAAFLPATVVTWGLNRVLSFSRSEPARHGIGAQYLRYLSVQGVGIAINFAVFYVATRLWQVPPLLAIAAGSITAMAFNFVGARLLVFAGRA